KVSDCRTNCKENRGALRLKIQLTIFFRTSAAKPASPSLQLNITPGRFLEEIRTLSSPPKEHHIRGPF
ncbi:hypothetical protein, partial [uncultured Slackia sp.]|uniref:hypothetical protein n=1 Tax=uncultured Slackia sp. TaxID=665903 RepID=UPI0025895460